MPGPQELLVIAFVALLVFGPDRLPELARNAAKILSRVRAEMSSSVDELKRAAEAEGLDREWREVSAELRGTRDQLRQPLGGSSPSVDPRAQAPASHRADDTPPPIDDEAT